MTAKQLAERARITEGANFKEAYLFDTKEELQAFVTALCKEQRKKCALIAMGTFSTYWIDKLEAAREPEVL